MGDDDTISASASPARSMISSSCLVNGNASRRAGTPANAA
jgi:hypothetical protein